MQSKCFVLSGHISNCNLPTQKLVDGVCATINIDSAYKNLRLSRDLKPETVEAPVFENVQMKVRCNLCTHSIWRETFHHSASQDT